MLCARLSEPTCATHKQCPCGDFSDSRPLMHLTPLPIYSVLLLLCGACQAAQQGGSSDPARQAAPSAAPRGLSLPGGQAAISGPKVSPLEEGNRAERVLHLGDSMVPLVANYLQAALATKGRYEAISTASSTTLSWAEDPRLPSGIKQLDPDLVLISLGSNEIFVREDLAAHIAAAKRIVAGIGARPCLWIGPPAWAKGYGFVEALSAAVAPCGYFASEKLSFERQADGRHPTWAASYGWANAVWKRLGGKNDLTRR